MAGIHFKTLVIDAADEKGIDCGPLIELYVEKREILATNIGQCEELLEAVMMAYEEDIKSGCIGEIGVLSKTAVEDHYVPLVGTDDHDIWEDEESMLCNAVTAAVLDVLLVGGIIQLPEEEADEDSDEIVGKDSSSDEE